VYTTRFRESYLRVREKRRHRQRSRVRDMCREVEETGDLKWNTWSWEYHIKCSCTKEGAHSEMNSYSISEDEKHVRLVVTLILEAD
jgi:hypothetical protein